MKTLPPSLFRSLPPLLPRVKEIEREGGGWGGHSRKVFAFKFTSFLRQHPYHLASACASASLLLPPPRLCVCVCVQCTGRAYAVRAVAVPASRSAHEVDDLWRGIDAQVTLERGDRHPGATLTDCLG